MSAKPDIISILSTSLLDDHRDTAEQMRRISRRLETPLGWHYLLDLSWAASALDPQPGMKVLDAGAGVGIMQWWLAGSGADVLSVDRLRRAWLPVRFDAHCPVRGLDPRDLHSRPLRWLRGLLPPAKPSRWLRWPAKFVRNLSLGPLPRPPAGGAKGAVTIHRGDLTDLSEIADGSMDAVVSISALEHNDPAELPQVVSELMRVLKSGGRLLVTLCAARDEDTFHQPSRGWCYSEATLREAFDLPDCPDNYDRYDELLAALTACDELKEDLADFYFQSPDTGMPGGVWRPAYQPVGVCKTKA